MRREEKGACGHHVAPKRPKSEAWSVVRIGPGGMVLGSVSVMDGRWVRGVVYSSRRSTAGLVLVGQCWKSGARFGMRRVFPRKEERSVFLRSWWSGWLLLEFLSALCNS
jgi:hypothetical protein